MNPRRRVPAASLALAAQLLLATGSAAQTASPAPDRSDDRPVALVTGSTAGLGREVARRLARTGMHVIVHGRNAERGASLVQEIEAEGGSARFYAADLASFDEVRRLASDVRRDHDRLDLLVNNAGVWLRERRVSEDGHELQLQVNYLSGYLLTRLLLPTLVRTAEGGTGARIVNVSSRAQQPIDFDDPMLERGYDGGRAYAQSKLAQILFTFELAEELEGTGVTVNALHPASLMDTELVTDLGVEPRSTVAEGAEVVMHVATAPDLGTGRYFNRFDPARAHAQAYDEEARERLMRLSAELTGTGHH